MKSCVESGAKRFILFQDDVIFLNHWKETLSKAIEQLPQSFDLLHFSCATKQSPTEHSENLRRVRGARCLTATQFNSAGAAQIMQSLMSADSECDVWFERKIHPEFECYEMNPSITRQRAGLSSIIGICKGESP
jgi:GR25 family glycosyltransferase involved in LPS biosynthesis